MRRVHAACAVALAALGVFYLALAPATWGASPSMELVSSLDSGLVLVLAGFLNLAAPAAPHPRVVWLCRIANLLMLALNAIAVAAMPEPQNWLALILIVILTIGSFLVRISRPTGG